MDLESEDIGRRLHEALLLIQRRNRKARLAFKSDLAPFDAVTISIAMNIPSLTPSTLSRYLKLPPHRISRLLADLTKRGFIKSEQALKDKRSKIINFTPAGKRAAQAADLITWKVVGTLSAEFSARELEDAVELLTALADDVSSFALIERDIVAALKRVTAGLGMQSDNYADTGMSLASFQILFDLWRNGGIRSFKDLSANFPLSASSLSRECDSLQIQGLVSKASQASDRRSTSVTMTSEGRVFFLGHHSRISALFYHATRFLDTETRNRGLSVLTRMAVEPPKQLSKLEPLQSLNCRSVAQRHRARAFLVEELVRTRQHLHLDSQLLPSKHECIALTADGTIRAIIELMPTDAKSRSLRRFVCDATIEASHLRGVLEEFARANRIDAQSIKAAQIIPDTFREDIHTALLKARTAQEI